MDKYDKIANGGGMGENTEWEKKSGKIFKMGDFSPIGGGSEIPVSTPGRTSFNQKQHHLLKLSHGGYKELYRNHTFTYDTIIRTHFNCDCLAL